MSAQRDEIRAQIVRLRSLWPVLNGRQEHTQEIEQAIMRHAHRLEPRDITVGFSDAIEATPTTGWPPGPHEVLGCVLRARETRVAASAGAHPRSFGGGLTFAQWWHSLPTEERANHSALHRMMSKADEAAAVADEIEWEAA